MELQFEKNMLPCLQQVLFDTQSQELTQELRLPEGMPDIGQVTACWAQPVIRGKEWRGDRVSVNGGMMCWVLYTPEEEGAPQSIAAWLPFQMKWDIPQTRHDGTIHVHPFLCSADARSLSSRKLMLRVNVGAQTQALAPGEATVYAPGQMPPDVQLLKRQYPMLLPVESGEKAFSLEEDIPFPTNLPQPEQILRYSFTPQLSEWKVMTDKVVFRGMGYLHVLYRSTDGQLHTWDHELPISQYADLDKEYDNDAVVEVLPAVTNLEVDLMDGQICLKTGLTGQYVVYERPIVEVVEDAYSPVRQVQINQEDLVIPAVLDMCQNMIQVEQSVECDGNVIDIACYPDDAQQHRTVEGAQIRMPGVFQILGRNGEGQLRSINAYWEETEMLPVADAAQVQVTMQPVGVPQAIGNSGGVSMQAELRMDNRVLNKEPVIAVTGLVLGEERPKDPQRPSLILRRAGEDSLWQIAKETGTTVEEICKANHMDSQPEKSRMLIIPIP